MPVGWPSKVPILKDWPDRASTDPLDVEEMWAANPRAAVGVACGPELAVDLDEKDGKHGIANWEKWCADNGVAVIAHHQTTLSGGAHVIYRLPDGEQLGNGSGSLPKGIDIRGFGGYIVAYDDLPPVSELPDAPESLLEALRRPEPRERRSTNVTVRDPALGLHPYAERAIGYELDKLDQLTGGEPNWDIGVYNVACNLIEFANSPWSGYTLEQARADFENHAPTDNSGFPESRRDAKWESALQTVGDGDREEPEDNRTTPEEVFNVVDDETKETDGAQLLDDLVKFLSRFVAYPTEAARNAHALWIVHAHLMDQWDSTPRIAFLSPEPGSGKTRCLEVTEHLVPRPVQSVNVTPAYLFRKVSDPSGLPTVLYDEIDTVFGPKAKDNEEVRGLINAGHRPGATAGRCVVQGKRVVTEELPAYCAVAMAGLNDLPDTIMSRSVVIRMRRRAAEEEIEPWRHRDGAALAAPLYRRISSWADHVRGTITATWPTMPPEITDRDADIWEALLAVADAAGGHWPATARVTAVTAVTDSREGIPSLGVTLLQDLRTIFNAHAYENLETTTIIHELVRIEESPWGRLRGREIEPYMLAQLLRPFGVKPKTFRRGDKTYKGYNPHHLEDAWRRYLPEPSEESVTLVTPVTDEDLLT